MCCGTELVVEWYNLTSFNPIHIYWSHILQVSVTKSLLWHIPIIEQFFYFLLSKGFVDIIIVSFVKKLIIQSILLKFIFN